MLADEAEGEGEGGAEADRTQDDALAAADAGAAGEAMVEDKTAPAQRAAAKPKQTVEQYVAHKDEKTRDNWKKGMIGRKGPDENFNTMESQIAAGIVVPKGAGFETPWGEHRFMPLSQEHPAYAKGYTHQCVRIRGVVCSNVGADMSANPPKLSSVAPS